jgi:hypothetical protein
MQRNPDCSDANPGSCIYFPEFTSIHPVQSGGGGSDFLSMAANGAGCFGGCPLPVSFNGLPVLPSELDFHMFGVGFHTAGPVTRVTALQMVTSTGPTVGSEITSELLAFDGQQLVAACLAQAPGGCFTDTQVTGTINGNPIAYQGNLTVSAPIITSVWIGTAPGGCSGPCAQGVSLRSPNPTHSRCSPLPLSAWLLQGSDGPDLRATQKPETEPLAVG